jgi:hypothetical protein
MRRTLFPGPLICIARTFTVLPDGRSSIDDIVRGDGSRVARRICIEDLAP